MSRCTKVDGRSKTRLWRIWQGILRRCYTPSQSRYPYYGARGIGVHESWLSFDQFRNDMGDPPNDHMTIERLDFTKDYGPGNCCWATRRQQANNRSTTRWFEMNGQRKSMAEWCRDFRMPYQTVMRRIKFGWPIDQAIVTPVLGRWNRRRGQRNFNCD